MSLKNRIPNTQQIIAVYGVISFIIYGWTLLQFFWRLPSWEYFFTTGNIFTVLAYALATNLLESLTVLLLPLMLSIILPGGWFKDVFVSRASILVMSGLGYIIYVSRYLTSTPDYYYPINLLRLTPAIGVLIFLLAFLIDRVSLLRKVVEDIADRSAIFTYIFMPLGIVSLLVVIARNIF